VQRWPGARSSSIVAYNYLASFFLRISISSKSWSTKAFGLPTRLELDKLDAWRLLDAPFDFERIESLKISGQRLNPEWAIEQYPIKRPQWRGPEESKHQTLTGADCLDCVIEWAPKFSARLKRVLLRGPDDYRLAVSSHVMEALSASPVSASLQKLDAEKFSISSFSASVKLHALTKLKLFEFQCTSEPAPFLDLLIECVPNLEYLMIDFDVPGFHRLLFKFKSEHRRALFSRFASFPRLRTVSYSDEMILSALRQRSEVDLRAFVDDVKRYWPSTIELKVVMRASKKLEHDAALPDIAWALGWNCNTIVFLEEQFPATAERPRSTESLIRRVADASMAYTLMSQLHFDHLELWCRLHNMGSFVHVDSSGASVLSSCLLNHPVLFIKQVVDKTMKDISGMEQYHLGAKLWSDLSPQEKAEDHALYLATCSRSNDQTVEVLEYLASDAFPAPLRCFLNSTAPLNDVRQQLGLLRSTLLFSYNPRGMCVLLRAGVPSSPITEETLALVENKTLLTHELNLEIIQLLWASLKPLPTASTVAKIIETVLAVTAETWERKLPNLPSVIQFFLDQGAAPPVSEHTMRNLLRCGLSIPMDMFQLLLDANKPQLSVDQWTRIFLDAVGDWKVSTGTERLAALLECGADPSRALTGVFQPGWDTKLEWALPLTEFLLDNGADPDAVDTNGFSALQMAAVYFPDGDMFSEEPEMLDALVALFSDRGYSIPMASEKVSAYINARLEDEKRLYDDGYML
jgi:hypothetical protein